MDDARLTYWTLGAQLVEGCLARAVRGDHADAPFPLDEAQAKLWHRAQAEAFRHALEMMAPPEDGTSEDTLRNCNDSTRAILAKAAADAAAGGDQPADARSRTASGKLLGTMADGREIRVHTSQGGDWQRLTGRDLQDLAVSHFANLSAPGEEPLYGDRIVDTFVDNPLGFLSGIGMHGGPGPMKTASGPAPADSGPYAAERAAFVAALTDVPLTLFTEIADASINQMVGTLHGGWGNVEGVTFDLEPAVVAATFREAPDAPVDPVIHAETDGPVPTFRMASAATLAMTDDAGRPWSHEFGATITGIYADGKATIVSIAVA